jgi:hypothetical protein
MVKGEKPNGLKIENNLGSAKPEPSLDKAFMTVRPPKHEPSPAKYSKAGVTPFQGKR